ncbi:DUF2271 domain-containing protein [Rheinheimera sp. MMS21-TC3]|uniref:DUF2271 domain-containing protein n=1 Tax=Rheinheimera sp. MMS21-TC3 TaxID=3072790 RepID=UPI0028C441E5|nr:DUF2271 domain-containing protein [Rheinheimera sp. MMS21-TC3]WNO61984.1 DUF2271 domain-containing protein [Rheinheimera sp. MMS21-TC3]
MRWFVIGLAVVISIFNPHKVVGAELQLTVSLPRLNVAEYHSPYVAAWIEDDARKITQIAVWYDTKLANNKGQEWLKDLRQWWRKGGRALNMPVDGLSGATKGPGQHTIQAQLSAALATLPAGEYRIMVEAAREVGGRELLQLPIKLPLTKSSFPLEVAGKAEIELIRLHF